MFHLTLLWELRKNILFFRSVRFFEFKNKKAAMHDSKTMQSGFKKQMRKICMCLKIKYWGGGGV